MRDILMTLLWGVAVLTNLAACLLLGGLAADTLAGGPGVHTLLGFIAGLAVWFAPIYLAFELGNGDSFLDHY